MKLWRPTGIKELEKVEARNWEAWPPRLPEQPIFYPVLNFEYAEQIARDWNSTKENHDFTGYVTEFEVDTDYAKQFEAEVVGAKMHEELWVPAEKLDEFNQHIIGKIKVVATYRNGQRVE